MTKIGRLRTVPGITVGGFRVLMTKMSCYNNYNNRPSRTAGIDLASSPEPRNVVEESPIDTRMLLEVHAHTHAHTHAQTNVYTSGQCMSAHMSMRTCSRNESARSLLIYMVALWFALYRVSLVMACLVRSCGTCPMLLSTRLDESIPTVRGAWPADVYSRVYLCGT